MDWWPWVPEAFVAAAAQDKPVLVSVGYSSCHWCHVMARESFEQPWIAELMNRHFICIKVDREEMPEVDKLMMDAVQMVHGHGGWPLNCFCLPDGRPFFGGTYFPPEDRGQGQVPWPQLIMRVADFYHRSKDELAANAEAISRNLTHLTQAPEADGRAPSHEDLVAAARTICEQHDDTHGGFGGAPKFPTPPTLGFLLAVRASLDVPDRELATRLDAVLTMTLGAMARGGLFDQIGGGFHRYCVDRDWTVPHFEKMLYDNAQLLGVYAEAWARYREPLYLRVCEEIVAWLRRDMRTSDGLFAASLDADTDHHEGTTYVWKSPEIAAALGTEAFAFAQAYGITDQGNFEGANIPRLRAGFAERERFTTARERLLALRQTRPQPGRDDKTLLGWNALLVGNLAKAAWIFGRRDWFDLATETEAALWARHATLSEGIVTLRAVGHGTETSGQATLTDFAWLAEAELSLAAYAAWGAPEGPAYAERATCLLHSAEAAFGDPRTLGYYLTPADRTDLAVRQKDWFDNAVPAGNSSLLHGFSALHALTGDGRWAHELAELSKAYGGACRNIPNGVAYALEALMRQSLGLVVLKLPAKAADEALRSALCGDEKTPAHHRPHRPVRLVPEAARTDYQACVGTACLPPTTSAASVAKLI